MVFDGIVVATAAGITIALMLYRMYGRILTVCALITGIAAVQMAQEWAAWALEAAGSATGTDLPFVTAVACTVWVLLEIKTGGTGAATPWVALLLYTLWTLAGGPFEGMAGLLDGLTDTAETAINQ